jgi:hypothetical protein
MPQLAAVSSGPEDAFKKMAGRAFVMDCKFDGERVQVNTSNTWAFSSQAMRCRVRTQLVVIKTMIILMVTQLVVINTLMVPLLPSSLRNFIPSPDDDQMHKVGDTIHYFSRRGLDHGVKSDFAQLDPLIRSYVKGTGVVLDGELVVWNKSR